MKVIVPAAAACAVAVFAYVGLRSSDKPLLGETTSRVLPVAQDAVAVQSTGADVAAQRTPGAEPTVERARRSPPEIAIAQQFERLRGLPAGDAAISLGRDIEDAYNADNGRAYVEALVAGDNSVVERSAMSALARSADTPTLLALAEQYGSLPQEKRGRVLQVLEGARNPDALQALTTIASAETHEKRSALFMSALYGMASIGTMESVNQLLSEMSNGNVDYALMALERVRSRQGAEIILSAAEGGKDGGQIDPSMRPALRRVAQAVESSLPK